MHGDPETAMPRDIRVTGKRRRVIPEVSLGVCQVVKVGEGSISSKGNNQCESLEGGLASED